LFEGAIWLTTMLLSYHGNIEERLNVTLLVIFSKSLIGDTLFSYLVLYLENERQVLIIFYG